MFLFKIINEMLKSSMMRNMSLFGNVRALKKNSGMFSFVRLLSSALFSGLLFVILYFTVLDDKSSTFLASMSKDVTRVIEQMENNDASNKTLQLGSGGEGLNLLLIAKMNDTYNREYLQILNKNEKGELNDYKDHLTVQGILGLLISEQGTYSGSDGSVPTSNLAWRNGKVLWKDSSSGVSPEEDTLTNATRSVFESGLAKSSSYAPNGDGDSGPFQQRETYYSRGPYKASKMNKSRQADCKYFPDQVGNLDLELDNAKKYIDCTQPLDEFDKYILTSLEHNVGGGWSYQQIQGSNPQEKRKSFDDYKTYYQAIVKKYRPIFANDQIQDFQWKFIGTMALMEQGWAIEQEGVNYIKNQNNSTCLTMFKKMGLGSTQADMDKFFAEHTGVLPRSIGLGTNFGFLFIEKNGFYHVTVTVTAGHNLSFIGAGPLYARILKIAGVGVDPTNPDSYMNKLNNASTQGGQGGQWVPGAGNLAQYGLDVKTMSANQVKLFIEANKFLGMKYVYGGNHNYWNFNPNGGVDCSSFTAYSYHNSFGINIGGYTGEQITSSTTVTITRDQLKPGDLIVNQAHVGMFVCWLEGHSKAKILHAPNPRTVVKYEDVGLDSGWFPAEGHLYYKHYPGLDN